MKWTDEQIALLRERYADDSTPSLADVFGRQVSAIEKMARRLGLAKSDERLRRARMFPPGASQPRPFGRDGEPLGTVRVYNGIAYRKVNAHAETHLERWRPLHEQAWIEANGPVPAGHIVIFKPGCKTTDPGRITAESVECITRADLMRRNGRHNLPPDLLRAIVLRAILVRRIHQKTEQFK